jgi:hypothetical protein
MAYILKDSTQGQVSVKLTDAGRKQLSEGKLNIELFQLGDSEYCYDCYNTLPNQSDGLYIQQANFNAQNLNDLPEKNKGHIKYPIPIGQDITGTTFGAVQAAHTYQEVYNRATQRGFYSASTGSSCCSYSAFTGSAYTLNANFFFPVSAMTGGSQVALLSANTFQNQAFSSATIPGYSPKVGDLLSIRYIFQSGATGTTNCFNLPCTTPSAQLFYQVTAGNSVTGRTGGTWKGSSSDPLYLTVDRNLPNFGVYSGGSSGAAHIVPIENYTGATGQMVGACVKVYPSTSGGTYSAQSTNPMLTYYGADTPIPYWSPGSLSFENNCDVSMKDVKVWNMNINWSETVAGIDTVNDGLENVNDYGSSGYCGTKEYLGYTSSQAQADTGVKTDYYNGIKSSSWYYDSYKNIKTVAPERQKAIAILHYTNQTISNFYGEKFSLKQSGSTETGLGEARNFRLNLPWLMWHKKNTGTSNAATAQEGCQGADTYGQCFYVDPPDFPEVFPEQPYVMQSTVNPNMNNNGLRYYYLWDTNSSNIPGENQGAVAGPNPVGKVFPDLKMVTIHDEELVAAMSYKSNRSWTLPSPRVQKIPAGTNCCGSATTGGVFTQPYQKLFLTYMIESNSGLTTGLHCNYYTEINNPNDGTNYDLEIEFGPEFPYLKPFDLGGPTGVSGGTGWQGNKIHLIWQLVNQPQTDPHPADWTKTEVTDLLGPTCGQFGFNNPLPFSGCQISSGGTKFYLTASNQATGTSYNLHDYINVPEQTTERDLLQFGDEYFLFGEFESDIMATIYEMKYYINLATTQFGGNSGALGAGNSLNPTYQKYYDDNGLYPNIYITEIGLFNNENSFPELMAIAKFMNPNLRDGAQQFVLTLDF